MSTATLKLRGTASRHARERMLERYGFGLTKQQWRQMAESIANAIARGESFELDPDCSRSDAGSSRWRVDVAIVTADDSMQLVVPVGFSFDGKTVTIVTILPGGKEVPMPR